MAVKNGMYFNRRQNPFTKTDMSKLIKSGEDYDPIKPYLDYNIVSGVGILVADLPEIPDLTKSIRIWLIDGQTVSSDYTRDATSDEIPAAGHYMVALADSDRPNLIKLPTNAEGKHIGFEYYGLGQVICAEDLMNLKTKTIETTGKVTAGSIQTSGAITAGGANIQGNGDIDLNGMIYGRGGLYTAETIQANKVLSSSAEINGEAKCQTLKVTVSKGVTLYYTSAVVTVEGSPVSFPILPSSLTNFDEFIDGNYLSHTSRLWNTWVVLFADAHGQSSDTLNKYYHEIVWQGTLAQYLRAARLGQITTPSPRLQTGAVIVAGIMVFQNYN